MADKIAELYVEIRAKTDQLEKDFNTLKAKTEKQGSQIGASFKSGFVKFIAAAGLATILVKALKNVVNAALESEAANNKLATALGRTSQALLDQAAALQKKTTYDDEAIVSAQAIFAAFTKNEDQIKALTTATLDYASATGIDLDSAAKQIAKTFAGGKNVLKSYGIEINGAAGSTKRLNDITTGITNLWGGTATSKLNTFSGRMENLKNRIGEVEEGIGKALMPTIEKLAGIFEKELNTNVEQSIGFFDAIAASGRIVGAVFSVVWGVLKEMGIILGTLGAALVALATGDFPLAVRIIQDGGKLMGQAFTETVDSVVSMFDGIAEKSDVLSDAGGKMDRLTDSTKKQKTAVDELIAADDKLKTKIQEIVAARENDKLTITDQNALLAEEIKLRQELAALPTAEDIFKVEAKGIETGKTLQEKIKEEAPGQLVPVVENPMKPAEESVDNMEDKFASILNAATSLSNTLGIAADSFAGKLISAFDTINSLANSVLGIISAFSGGGAGGIFGLIGSLFGAHGGVFEGGKQVQKFSGGGDFTVPSGFSNDQFPMAVSSGERVTVTPTGRVGEETKYLAELVGVGKATNKSIAVLTSRIDRLETNINIDGKQLVKQVTKPIENKLKKVGINVDAL